MDRWLIHKAKRLLFTRDWAETVDYYAYFEKMASKKLAQTRGDLLLLPIRSLHKESEKWSNFPLNTAMDAIHGKVREFKLSHEMETRVYDSGDNI